MFILYAIPIGLLLGLVLGGRPGGLATMHFRWGSLFALGLFAQVVLFSDQVSSWIGPTGAIVYVASTALVLATVVANRSIPGLPVVALGGGSNLAAIVANGGYMPASASALAAIGKSDPIVYSNSKAIADPLLGPLTDVFAMPSFLPFANVFSVGDVLIGIGVAVAIAVAMRRPTPEGSDAAATASPERGGASAH